MKQILFTVAFTIFLSANLFAQNQILQELIDLPAPPPISKTEKENDGKIVRDEDFYDDKNVPSDDAAIEDVFDYWKRKAAGSYYGNNKPPQISAKNASRLIEKFALEPENLSNFLKILPKDSAIAEKVKNVFDVSQQAEGIDNNWRELVKGWLKFNSKFYINEMAVEVSNAKDQIKYGTVANEDELIALTKLDWETAKPILRKLEADKANIRTLTLAKTLLYKDAIAVKDESSIEKYRNELKEIVSNRNFPARARDSAIEALSETEWNGQDNWYLSLLEDESLLSPTDGNYLLTPLTTITSKNPDKWVPILTKLIGNKNRAIHTAAVLSLMEIKRKDSLEPLLPWLSNPDWTDIHWSGNDRVAYMQIVSNFDLPESVPGLIWIVENEDENAHWAARSLGKFKDQSATPALKNSLQRIKDESDRTTIIEALIDCDGLTVEEQMSALENYAEFIKKPENVEKIQKSLYSRESLLTAQVSIGKFLSERNEPSEDLIRLAIERQKILQKEKPEAAKVLSGIMAKWQGRLIDLEMIDRIADGKADVETIIGALARRKELKERVSNELYILRGKSGLAGATAACLIEDDNDILSAFHSEDVETQIGTLACARLLRKSLPVRKVGVLLDSPNRLLTLAAERYLESEDSPEAGQLVLSKHPGEALILGARTSFNPAKKSEDSPMLSRLFGSVDRTYGGYLRPETTYAESDKFEDKLRDELKSNPELLEIYTIVPSYVVRVFKDRIIFTALEDKARFREGEISKEHFEDLKRFLDASNLEETPPIFGSCHHNCGSFEYARFNRNGGRRFYAYTNFTRFITIWAKFQMLGEANSVKTHYYLSDKIKGLEFLFADKRFHPQAVWKNGDDFRVLVSDEERKSQIEEEIRKLDKIDEDNEDLDYEIRGKNARQRRIDRAVEHYEWREFKDGKLGERVDEPIEIPFLRDKLAFPVADKLRNNDSIEQSRFGNYEIRAGENNEGGLWKTNRSERIEFKKGIYSNPIVSGNWVVAAKAEQDWAAPNNVVRINLQTGKESKINLPPAEEFQPIAFVAALNKVLLYRGKEAYSTLNPTVAEYYLLDANTGKTELIKGEFQPLITNTFRPLQPTGKTNEFWATVYSRAKNETDFGVYNTQNFSFKPLMKLPETLLNSTEIWVDEKTAKIYFIYGDDFGRENHLLRLPLPTAK